MGKVIHYAKIEISPRAACGYYVAELPEKRTTRIQDRATCKTCLKIISNHLIHLSNATSTATPGM